MKYELHAAGKRGPETLLGELPDYPAALAAWEATQSGDRPAWSIVPIGRRDELESLGGVSAIVPGYDYGKSGRGGYIVDCGGGYTCPGFAYIGRQTRAVSDWLASEGAPLPAIAAAPDSPEFYAAYTATMAAGADFNRRTGKRCPADLIPEFIGREGESVEVVDCHGETRRFIIGKSGGWFPIHLEIESKRSSGGGGVTGAPFQSVRFIASARAAGRIAGQLEAGVA